MSCNRVPQIGEVYLMEFTGDGSEQTGWRPGVVFQNNTGNAYSPNIIALPLTTSLKRLDLPTHVLLYAGESGLKYDSVVLCENPHIVSKERMGRYLTTLPDEYMKKVAEASLLASSAIAFLDFDRLLKIWAQASNLNFIRS